MKYKNRSNIKYWDGIESDRLERNVYDRINKKYWNDEKKKWVGYKLKGNRISNNKFYIYEFECFGIKECKLLFADLVNVDRVLKFIDLLYRRYVYNKSSDGLIKYLKGDYVRILIKDCENIIGNGKINYENKDIRLWECVLKILDDSDIIDVYYGGKNKYDSNKSLWWCRLNDDFLKSKKKLRLIEDKNLIKYFNKKNDLLFKKFDKRSKWELECCKLLELDIENKIDRIIDKRFESKKNESIDKLSWEILSDKSRNSKKMVLVRKWVNNVSDSIFYDDFEEEYKDILKKEYYNFQDVLSNIKKNNLLDDRFFVNNEFDGRYYNVISNLNRNYRKYLKLDGEEIVEVDIRNSYISLFFCLIGFIVEFENEKSFSVDVFEEIRNRCKNKWGFGFYEYYNDLVFNKSDVDFYKIIGFKLFGMSYNKSKRNYVKEIVNRLINSSDLVLNNWSVNGLNIRDIKSRIFMDDGMEFVDEIKSVNLLDIFENIKDYKRYKNLNILVGRLESEVMRKCMDLLMDNNIKFISLFDSFLIKKVDSEKVLIMLNIILQSYGNKLKFKI